MIECERFKTNPQKMQHKTATNILSYGECLRLRHQKLAEQSDEIYGVNTINWGDSWRSHESLAREGLRFFFFSDSVLCFGNMSENPQSNIVLEDKLTWFKSSSQYRILDTFDGEPMEFEWNIFSGFTTLQLCNKVQELLSKMSKPEDFTGRIIFMSIFNDISW